VRKVVTQTLGRGQENEIPSGSVGVAGRKIELFRGHTMFFIMEQTWNCEKRQPFSGMQYCFLSQEEKWNCKARWLFSGHSCFPHRKENGTSRIGIRLQFLTRFLAIQGGIGKFLDSYCLTALVKEEERGGQGHSGF
jgi:hypothetical protein